jgi:hypothetical protein
MVIEWKEIAMKHPSQNEEYLLQPDGRVKVTDLDSGKSGWFEYTGRWTDGELRFADVQMIGWVAGPSRRSKPATDG